MSIQIEDMSKLHLVAKRLEKMFMGAGFSGLCGKEQGRIGDSPIVGAGNFADNRTGVSHYSYSTKQSFLSFLLSSQTS